MLILAAAFSASLVATPLQNNVPEPQNQHIGYVAGAYSFLSEASSLGEIDLDILDEVYRVHSVNPELFFWPHDLGSNLSPEFGEVRETVVHPNANVQLLYIVGFAGFGYSLSSVIFLWAILFFLGVALGLLAPLPRPAVEALGLILGVLMATVSSLPFLDVNSLSVLNQRVLPLLIVFPVSALILLLMTRKKISARMLPAALLVGVFLGFVIVGRQTAIWAIAALLTASLVSGWGLRGLSLLRYVATVIILLTTIISSIQLFSSSPWVGLGKSSSGGNLSDNFVPLNDSVNPTDTMRWHSINIGLFTDPRLYEKYVCNDNPPKVFPVAPRLPCSGETVTATQALVAAANPGNPYRDLTNYNAVIRYVEERGFNQELELPPARVYGELGGFPMNWTVLGEVSREITLEMFTRDPGAVIQNLILVKPVRLLLALLEQPVLALSNVGQVRSSPLLLIPLVLVSGIFVFVTRDIFREKIQAHYPSGQGDQYRETVWALFILAASSSLIAIAFYAQSHTVLDIGVLTVSLLAFLAIHSALRKWQRARPSLLARKPAGLMESTSRGTRSAL